VTSSQWAGAVVGTFLVGDGHVVGPPVFQPAKPKMTLKGKHFQVNVVAMLKQVNLAKATMPLGLSDITHPPNYYFVNVSSKVSPAPTSLPKLTLRGKAGLRIVTPGRQVTGRPRMTVKAKTFRLNRSNAPRIGKAKMTLRGGKITKVGKAGLVPSIPINELLVPSGIQAYGNLSPSPASGDDLLVPTTVGQI